MHVLKATNVIIKFTLAKEPEVVVLYTYDK